MKKAIICLLFSLLLCCTLTKPVSAFAGGGGADYNGGGGNGGDTGGGTTHNDHWSDHSDSNTSNESNPFAFLFSLGVGAFVLFSGRKKYRSSSSRKEIDILDYQNPEEVVIDQEVEKIFYLVQEAWQKQNLSSVEKYYGKELLQLHTKKITKMKNKHQKNIIEDLVLRKVGNLKWLEAHQKFSVEIEARAIDYVVDTQSNRVIKGRKEEYGLLREKWFFQKGSKEPWILYRIK
ncbi:TIM44-like domain-containing protein [Isobaculum melis]|uniref:Tim44-like domain-containing protein n=1 Tax=Isobaculum melis TaxID=142588 RepID=A0A1H9SER5_9LACT|nr:TIM44-like domain-containing protein [Isobaculum melis]SER83512.1 Tim44-like domain-containing protein [Isobaculum melis]